MFLLAAIRAWPLPHASRSGPPFRFRPGLVARSGAPRDGDALKGSGLD